MLQLERNTNIQSDLKLSDFVFLLDCLPTCVGVVCTIVGLSLHLQTFQTKIRSPASALCCMFSTLGDSVRKNHGLESTCSVMR